MSPNTQQIFTTTDNIGVYRNTRSLVPDKFKDVVSLPDAATIFERFREQHATVLLSGIGNRR